jgi:hypothetical protein
VCGPGARASRGVSASVDPQTTPMTRQRCRLTG